MFEMVVIGLGGLVLCLIGLFMETSNFRSFMLFKFIPLILGILQVFIVLSGLDII